jgi:hypothetical protein
MGLGAPMEDMMMPEENKRGGGIGLHNGREYRMDGGVCQEKYTSQKRLRRRPFGRVPVTNDRKIARKTINLSPPLLKRTDNCDQKYSTRSSAAMIATCSRTRDGGGFSTMNRSFKYSIIRSTTAYSVRKATIFTGQSRFGKVAGPNRRNPRRSPKTGGGSKKQSIVSLPRGTPAEISAIPVNG